MKTTLLAGVLSAFALTAMVGVADAQSAFPACFQGDTMDRDGGHTGRLGSPECQANAYTGRSVAENVRHASPNDAYGEYNGVNR